ncbi:titin-like [Paramacrobiotus metropolitanus]|uniref:titin-like n=1 Tax=Paramacrobiotus metropolitanus TaxID=2943436 RepID=UPI0024462742|nr:titin-like [Paramacrobiotus metropolitanus]
MWPVRFIIFALGITYTVGINPDAEGIEAARDDKVDALTAALLNPLPAIQNYPNAREARGSGFGNFASLFGGGGGGGSMFGGGGSMLSNMFSGFTNVVDRVSQAMGGPAMPKNIKQAIADGPRNPLGSSNGLQAPRMTRPGPDVFRRIEERKKKVKGHGRRKRQSVSVKAMKKFNNLGKEAMVSMKNTPFTDDLTAILLGITEFFSGLKNLGRTPVSRINEKTAAFQNGAQKLVERAENLPNSLFGTMRSKREVKNDTKTAPKIEYVPVPSAMVNGKIVPVALPEELANVIPKPPVENIPIPSAMVNGKIVPVALPEDLMQPKVQTVPVPSAMVNGKIIPVAFPEELTKPEVENIPVPSAMVNGKIVPVALPEELTQPKVETIPVPSAVVNGKIVPVAIPEELAKPEVETVPVPSAMVNGKIVPVAIPEELNKADIETVPIPSAIVNGKVVPVAIPEDMAKPDYDAVPVPSAFVNGRIVPVALPEELTKPDMEIVPVPSALVNGKVVPVALPEELTKPEMETIPIPSAMVNGHIVPVAIPEDIAQPSENIPIPSAMINGNIVPVAVPEDMGQSPEMPVPVPSAMINGRILPVGIPNGMQPPVQNIPIPSAMVHGRLVPVAVPAEDADDYDQYEEVPVPSAMVNGQMIPVGQPPMMMPPPSGFPLPMGMAGRLPSDDDNDVRKEVVNHSLRELAVAHQENWFTYLRSLNGSTTECHEWDFCQTARASNLFETSVARNGAKLLSYVVAYLRDRRDKVGHRLAQAVDCCLSDNPLMGERCESYYHEKCLKSDPKYAKSRD